MAGTFYVGINIKMCYSYIYTAYSCDGFDCTMEQHRKYGRSRRIVCHTIDPQGTYARDTLCVY